MTLVREEWIVRAEAAGACASAAEWLRAGRRTLGAALRRYGREWARLAQPTELAELAADRCSTVRAAVAEHPDCPPELLEQLATDRFVTVRAWMAQWAPSHGIVGVYGDPARGFAGGYDESQ